VFQVTDGNCYRCIANNNNQTPPNPLFWVLEPVPAVFTVFLKEGAYADTLIGTFASGEDQIRLARAAAADKKATENIQGLIDDYYEQGHKHRYLHHRFWHASWNYDGTLWWPTTGWCCTRPWTGNEVITFAAPSAVLSVAVAPSGPGLIYLPTIVSVSAIEPSLKSFPTAGLALDTLVMITAGDEGQSWRLDPGMVDPTDPNQVSPADYNVVSNDKHWIMVSTTGTGGGASLSGITQLVNGQGYIDVTFATAQANAYWKFVEQEIVNTDDPAPLNIWPGILTSKTATGFRLQLNGTPDSNNYFLHWAITPGSAPPAPTTYTLSGPTSGLIATPSTNFTVALPGGLTLPGPLTVTPTDGGGGGTFTPASVVLTTGTPSATFTYTPASTGSKTISTSNDGGLTDPAVIHYNVTGYSTTYTLAGPSSGKISVASTNFTVALPGGGALASPVTITPSDGGAGGTFTPTTVNLSTAAPSATFTYTPSSYGARTISVTNSGTLTNPANLTYTSLAATYTLSGPGSGGVGTPSTNFTVALPAGGVLLSAVTITPNDSANGGTFTPTTVNLTTAAPSATFTYTPASTGAKTIAVTNSGTLTNPGSLSYVASDAHLLNTLISYWKLDETSALSTRIDSYGTNNLDFLGGSPVGVGGGIIGNAGQFLRATNQLVGRNDNASLRVSSSFTFSCWVKLLSQPPAGLLFHLVSKGATVNEYAVRYHQTLGFIFSVNSTLSTDTAAQGTTTANGVWTHVVGWYDLATGLAHIRLNDAATYDGTTATTLITSTEGFAIGGRVDGAASVAADALIDEVGFWKRLLTSAEITALYNGGAGLPLSSFTT
jgi:hypothetical protein